MMEFNIIKLAKETDIRPDILASWEARQRISNVFV